MAVVEDQRVEAQIDAYRKGANVKSRVDPAIEAQVVE